MINDIWILGVYALVIIAAILYAINTWKESNIYQKILLIAMAVILILILIFGGFKF